MCSRAAVHGAASVYNSITRTTEHVIHCPVTAADVDITLQAVPGNVQLNRPAVHMASLLPKSVFDGISTRDGTK